MVFSEEQAWPGQAMLSFECSLGNSQKFRRNYSAGGWPVTWTQVYDPLGHWWLSTLVAALPIIVLLGLRAGLKVRPHLCAVAGAATAVICAMVVFGMPARLAVSSFFYGSAFGLLKIVWIVIAAAFLYDNFF